jgi:23S rRNA pseudouridine1911/1915/1917 synthase
MVEVKIETGRTHQIRVHMQSLGHPVVGDFLYGAPHRILAIPPVKEDAGLELDRNFLHAAHLVFVHPTAGKTMEIRSPLPADLAGFLEALKAGPETGPERKLPVS